jgi:hypothetical protein
VNSEKQMVKLPIDPFPYEPDPDSQPLRHGLPDGCYVYVQDVGGTVHVLPDGPHRHPYVLGNALPATYAGDFDIRNGRIKDLTNLSGTFLFDDPQGLLQIAILIESLGIDILPGAVRFVPVDGTQPIVLR